MAKPAKVIDLQTRKARTEPPAAIVKPFFSPGSYEILDLRTALEYSQEAFARLIGVSFATVNRWERGRARPSGLALEFLRALQLAKKRDRLLRAHLETWAATSNAYLLHKVFALAIKKKGARR